MKHYNEEDLYRYEKNYKSWKIKLKYLLFVPGFQYSYCFRNAQNASNSISRFFWIGMLRIMMYHSGFQIPWNTKIGPGIRFSHWGTVIVNPNSVIGKNFTISAGCTIGSAQGKRKGYPTLGDNVIMQTNSVVVGNVKIGNDVLIAPSAFVNFDVPDNCIVIGNPGKIIQRETSPTNAYIDRKIEEMGII